VQDTRVFIYRVDAQDRIVFANAAWYDFARENGGETLHPKAVVGAPLWGFLCNAETQHLFQSLLRQVRDAGRPVTVPFRCDSPDCRRFMELELARLPDQVVEFRSRILRQERRAGVPLLDETVARSESMLTMCAWCKKVKLPDERWAEVEEAVNALQLFAVPHLPRISHGVCDECRRTLVQHRATP
jgi:hypothetical protein